jgi:hypothetical protein
MLTVRQYGNIRTLLTSLKTSINGIRTLMRIQRTLILEWNKN